jgi:hypothetical protein
VRPGGGHCGVDVSVDDEPGSEIDISSARRNRRISAQSSTLNTHFLSGSVAARVIRKVVSFRVPRPVQFSDAVDTSA